MDWLLLISAGLAVFAVRDALLWRGSSQAQKIQLVCGITIACLALAWTAERISRDAAYAILRDPIFYGPAIAGHLTLWAILWRFRERAIVFALIPAPLQLFALGGLCWLILNRSNGWPWYAAGLAAALLSVALPWLLLFVFRAERETAIRFAATANLSAILLLPLQQQSSNDPQNDTPIDWASTILPLAITAAMVAASYLLHRLRSSRK